MGKDVLGSNRGGWPDVRELAGSVLEERARRQREAWHEHDQNPDRWCNIWSAVRRERALREQLAEPVPPANDAD